MLVGSQERAVYVLERVSYYRLSGYYYSFRRSSGSGQRLDTFVPGTVFEDIVALYEYDRNLRSIAFSYFSQFEVYLRSRLGNLLGEVDPLIYEDETRLIFKVVKGALLGIDSREKANNLFVLLRKNS
ncbi:Abi family protein [Rothia mucilaginosa]|uniref:Abi family protein n=1 Tax=Rothia mucilaginosa TaxID=43675 RepID=UPI0026EB948F|nr:Abi family protein [Rothia mucilaginosa]